MKILHLPNNVAGFASGLADGERRMGHDSAVLTLGQSRFGFPADRCLDVAAMGRLGRLGAYARAFAGARRGYDLYHFGFGSSLWHFPHRGLYLMDLPFYDSRAKKAVTYQGCDARQKYPTMERKEAAGDPIAACFEKDCYGGMCNSGRKDLERRRAIDKAARHADHLFAVNPDLLRFLPAEKSSFLPYAVDGFHDLPVRRGPFFDGGTAHVVHAPTQRAAKGSRFILKALEDLADEMPGKLRVTVIEDMERTRALDIIATADLLIDQVLIGWYGGVAVEAMKIGVPVACYINDADLAPVPAEMAAALPVIRVTPFDVGDKVRDFLADRDMAAELSKRGRAFADRWHAPDAVAGRAFKALYGTETPAP